MPNWCSNTLEITGSKEKIAHIGKELDHNEGKNFFDVFVPNAEEVGKSEEWYSYNLENYGCKWNCDASDWEVEDGIDESSIKISFDSPWGPPIALYDRLMEEEGVSILASYFEPGMCFVGEYIDGEDNYYEYSGATSEDIYDVVPAELADQWGLYDMIVEQEEFDKEIEEEDDDKK